MTRMPEAVTTSGLPAPDPEVPATVQRRRFSAAYRLRILKAVDACKKPGEVGALSAAAAGTPGCVARGCTRRC